MDVASRPPGIAVTTTDTTPPSSGTNADDVLVAIHEKDGTTGQGESVVDMNSLDPESGLPVVDGKTEEEIFSQIVETLPMRQLMPAFLGVALTMFMGALDNNIVSTALPRIGTEFGSSNKVELVFTCYVITFNAFQGLYGKMSNVFGRKPTVFVALTIFVIGSVLSGCSQSMTMFLACRAITGIGSGGMFSLSNIIIADLVSIRDRGKYQGFISAVFAVAALIGPVMGGAFVDRVSWRWCFWIEVAFAAITMPILAIMLKLPRPKGNIWGKIKSIDWMGTFFMALLAVFLLLPTNLGGNLYAWNSQVVIDLPLIITMYALVVPTVIVFLYVEKHHAHHPIVPPYLWKNHNVAVLFCINIFMGMTFWSLLFYLPIYFQIVEHETATAAGLTMIPIEAGIFLSSNIFGILVSEFGKFKPFILIGTAIATIGVGLCLILVDASSKAVQVVILFVCGIGLGPLFPCLIVAIQASVERKDLATVSALNGFFRMTGSGFGVAINGALFQNQLNNALVASNVPQEWADLAKSSAQRIVEIPLEYRGAVEDIYLKSMKTVFTALVPMAAMMFVLAFLIRHVRLNVKARPTDTLDEKEKTSERFDASQKGLSGKGWWIAWAGGRAGIAIAASRAEEYIYKATKVPLAWYCAQYLREE
ncbi:hypothetical protein BGZ99_010048 [Dissophora globulifera]|uniref:Major facilitator superfamily (MFS) profile domain-containing protein n=1 Tax=Dissophora globulifera TaxID=979702 RepID=A0A9P6RS18_9FUNG|nr:hypothetical protein BGZ99_010048 [Dissophora globulifera]